MEASPDSIRPIWRKPLATVLAAWMALVIGATLAAGRLMEIVPGEIVLILAVGVFIAPVPILLVWSFWAMLREPMTSWLAPTILLTFCGAVVPAFEPLRDAGARLNFAAHKVTYAAVVDEAARIRALGDIDGLVIGTRNGVRYRYRAERPGEIDFEWVRNGTFEEGVRYDDSPCAPQPGRACADRGQPLEGFYSHYRMGF